MDGLCKKQFFNVNIQLQAGVGVRLDLNNFQQVCVCEYCLFAGDTIITIPGELKEHLKDSLFFDVDSLPKKPVIAPDAVEV